MISRKEEFFGQEKELERFLSDSNSLKGMPALSISYDISDLSNGENKFYLMWNKPINLYGDLNYLQSLIIDF